MAGPAFEVGSRQILLTGIGPMQRRSFLIWFSRTVYTACAATVAAPMLRFLSAPLVSNTASGGPILRRIATLDSLPTGTPQKLAVIGTRADGWTKHPDQVVGHVWVTRTSPPSAPADSAKVSVFNAACPHSGCPIQHAVANYVCPCHGAKFNDDGTKVTADGYTNPSPRGMDLLDHRLVKDDATGQWWVEVEYKEYEVGIADRVEKA
ncbi:MAG: Rieske 2Fe-2S domain-containing protein [Planctomycetota bacterium]|nr:Rieske 2Fe-2S domain-containing protein [Planctomycetota bacterium]